MGAVAKARIEPYISKEIWDLTVRSLTKDLSGPAFVGIDGASNETFTATLYHAHKAYEYLFRIPPSARLLRPVEIIELASCAPTIDAVLSNLNVGESLAESREAMLAEATAQLATHRKSRKRVGHRRNLALAELHLVWGWKNKADIYKHLGVTIARSDLDEVLARVAISDLRQHADGEACKAAALADEDLYRATLVSEDTAQRLRYSLVRGFAFRWYGSTPTLTYIGRVAGTFPARVNQICRRDYPQYRAGLKEMRASGRHSVA